MYATTISIPTKTEDNCSYASSILPNNGQQESKFDAFQYYSSDLLRLKTLLLGSDQDDDELSTLAELNRILRSAGLSDITSKNHASMVEDEDASKRRRGNNSEAIKQQQNESGTPPRKSRLSWELHPSLLLHDLDQDVEEVQYISDDEDEHVSGRAAR